jgi:hypothetical protein
MCTCIYIYIYIYIYTYIYIYIYIYTHIYIYIYICIYIHRWNDVRACRRRRQIKMDQTMPISTVFTTLTEFQFMEFKAIVDRVQWSLREKGVNTCSLIYMHMCTCIYAYAYVCMYIYIYI